MTNTLYERSLYCVRATTDAYCLQCGACGRQFLSVLVKEVGPKKENKND